MTRTTRSIATLAATALSVGLLAIPSAQAADVSGWSGACADPRIAALADDGDLLINYAGNAGCVAVRSVNGGPRLEVVVLNPGWSYTSKGSTSDGSRVQLQFSGPTSRDRVDFRIEPGKTRVG
jgi:hypothetical protein